jgi:hypothetical protein
MASVMMAREALGYAIANLGLLGMPLVTACCALRVSMEPSALPARPHQTAPVPAEDSVTTALPAPGSANVKAPPVVSLVKATARPLPTEFSVAMEDTAYVRVLPALVLETTR